MKSVRNIFALALLLVFTACHRYTYTLSENSKGELLDYSAALPDTGMQNMVAPYSKIYQQSMNEVVGYVARDMEKGFPEGTLGNFMADIFYDMALAQHAQYTAQNTFAIFNNGGLRVSLQKGAITRGKVFELMPFENVLTGVKLKGKYLLNEVGAYLLSKKGQPLSRNMYVAFKNNRLENMLIGGQAVDTAKTYLVLTSDYLANGGDNMDFFKKGETVDMGNLKLRDGIIQYFQKNTTETNPLEPPALGRIKME